VCDGLCSRTLLYLPEAANLRFWMCSFQSRVERVSRSSDVLMPSGRVFISGHTLYQQRGTLTAVTVSRWIIRYPPGHYSARERHVHLKLCPVGGAKTVCHSIDDAIEQLMLIPIC